MNDFISFIAFMLVGYTCSVGFVVTMVKVFFPFKTKEEWARVNAVRAAVENEQRLSRMRRALISKSGQLA